MLLTTLSEFNGSKEAVSTKGLLIATIDYSKHLNVNKVRIAPLARMSGNQDQKTGVDIAYMCIAGQGSIEIHGNRAPFKVGDLAIIKADENYSIINDNLEATIDIISIFG